MERQQRDTSFGARKKGLLKYLKTIPEIEALGGTACNKIADLLVRGMIKSGRKGCFEVSNEVIRLHLGFRFPHKGRAVKLEDREIEKIQRFLIEASKYQSADSRTKEMLKVADFFEELKRRRTGYRESRKTEEKIERRLTKNCRNFDLTTMLRDIVRIVDAQINKTDRRYKDQSFKLTATIMATVSPPNFQRHKLTPALSWRQIKGRVNKMEPVRK